MIPSKIEIKVLALRRMYVALGSKGLIKNNFQPLANDVTASYSIVRLSKYSMTYKHYFCYQKPSFFRFVERNARKNILLF